MKSLPAALPLRCSPAPDTTKTEVHTVVRLMTPRGMDTTSSGGAGAHMWSEWESGNRGRGHGVSAPNPSRMGRCSRRQPFGGSGWARTGEWGLAAPHGVHTVAYQLRYGRDYLGRRSERRWSCGRWSNGRIRQAAQNWSMAAASIGVGLGLIWAVPGDKMHKTPRQHRRTGVPGCYVLIRWCRPGSAP